MPRGHPLNAPQVAEYCERYYGAVYRYIAYRVGRVEDAEDLSSEVFVRLLESRPAVRVSVVAMLYRIAENLVIDHYRREASRKKVLGAGTDEELRQIADPGVRDPGERVDLLRGLKALSGEQYQVIVMRFLEGYTLQETAEALGKTTGAIKALQFRALEKMRVALGERVHETT